MEIKTELGKTDQIFLTPAKKLNLWRLIINTIISIVLFIIFCYAWTAHSPQWEILFYLTLWSFWMNAFYIISVTVCDWYAFCTSKVFVLFNDFLRNHYIKIIFPFAIAIVFMYWMLGLLGHDFQPLGPSVFDYCVSFFLHGMILIFLCFDVFTADHINKLNWKLDLGIITFMVLIYYVILGIGKYLILFDTYDFMMLCDIRQIAAACILIYIIVLDGYVVLFIIEENFFIKQNGDINYSERRNDIQAQTLKNSDEKKLKMKN